MSVIIFHIDVNSAFLSWEASHRLKENSSALDLRTIPAIIGGSKKERHGIVLAKSTLAKKFHIVTGEPIVNALKKCPDLMIVPPNFSIYVKASKAFMSILREYTDKVEQYSIDEAYCDVSEIISFYDSPLALANIIAHRIRTELGFTVNIGISNNKLLAKMASDFEKPDKIHTLFPNEIEEKMWPLPVEELFFVGKATAQKLHTLGIHTIGEIAGTDPSILTAHLKKQGKTIYEFSHGIDNNKITTKHTKNKGYGNSITTKEDVCDKDSAGQILLSLCETVATRLRMDQVKASCISVNIVDCNFKKTQHQMQLVSPTNITKELYQSALTLFEEAWDNHTPLRLLGVSTSKLTTNEYRQYDLFHMEEFDRLSKLDSAIDTIRNRFGDDSIKRACFLDSEIHHMTGKK